MFSSLFRAVQTEFVFVWEERALSDMQNLKGGKRGTRRSRGIENYSRLRKKEIYVILTLSTTLILPVGTCPDGKRVSDIPEVMLGRGEGE